MDKVGSLGSIILFSFVKLLLTHICHSRLVVDFEVSGTYVVRTGVTTYTVSTQRNGDVLIKCSSQISVTGTIEMLNENGETIASGDVLEDGSISASLWETYPTKWYTCVLNISTWISNDAHSKFFFKSEVEITRVSSWSFCASSVGNVGYVGEIATLTCNSLYYCYTWEGTNNKDLEIVLTEDINKSCKCSSWPLCSSTISVSQSLHINVSMIDNGTLSTTGSVMEFLCMGIPPRLMYWKVFGTFGNLLNFDNIGQQVNVNTTVNITQSPGQTFLRISETIPGGNGIHTVMCSTYHTTTRVVAFIHVKTPSESSFDFELSTFESTDIQDTTTYNPTKTDEPSTLAVSATERIENCDEFEIQVSTEPGDLLKTNMKINTIDNYLLVGLVSVPYLAIISILLGTVCFMRYTNKDNTQPSIAAPSQHIPSETILHENPAYFSFSETKEYTSDNENGQKTYANL